MVMGTLNDMPEPPQTTNRSAWLRSSLVPVVIFVLPGILLLAGGTSAPLDSEPAVNSAGQFFSEKLHPDNWPALLICSVLICLPGWMFYAGAEYLAEVAFAHLIPLNTTPAIIWRVLGYVVAMFASFYAFGRLVTAYGG